MENKEGQGKRAVDGKEEREDTREVRWRGIEMTLIRAGGVEERGKQFV